MNLVKTENIRIRYSKSGRNLRLFFISCCSWLILILAPLNAQYGNGNGKIRGRVVDELGAPIANVTVRATIFEGPHRRKDGETDNNGYFEITGLESENYILRTYNLLGYVDEYYNNAISRDSAEVIKVNENGMVDNIEFVLGTGGFISGHVFDALADTALSNIELIFLDDEHEEVSGLTSTDSVGNYKSPALRPGNYFIKAFGVSQGYIPLYWPNAEYSKDATRVTVQVNGNTGNHDFRLRIGGQINGRIFSDDDDSGVDSVWVVVLDSSEAWISEAWSDNGGYYQARGLRTGNYKVWIYEVNPWKFRPEYYRDSDNFEQAAWVPVNLPVITSNINFYLSPVHNAIVGNDIIEIAVTDRFPGTNLTIGTTGGLETPLDDNQSLLNGHPHPTMSYSTIRINNEDYRFGSKYGTSILEPTVNAENTSITRIWEIKDVEITQTASIVTSSWSHLRRDDTVKLEYLIINRGGGPQNIGLRILFDTKLGETDGAPIDIPYYGSSNYEREFSTKNMPPWWTAKSIEDGNIIFSAQGTLSDYEATTPDSFAIVRYEKIVASKWDYQIDPTQEYLEDSAVAMWWEPRKVGSVDSFRIVTYYGLGEDTPDLEAPVIIRYCPEKNVENVHPDSSIYLVIEDRKSGIDTASINIKIDNIPVEWKRTGSLKEMTLNLIPPELLKFNQKIDVEILNLQDLAPVPNVFEPESYSFSTLVDIEAPKMVSTVPETSATDVDVKTDIQIVLKDSVAGIDISSILMVVDGDTVNPVINGAPDLLTLVFTPPDSLDFSSRIDVFLYVKDLSDPANDAQYNWYFDTQPPINPDMEAPYITDIRPEPNSTGVHHHPVIEAVLNDVYAGVNSDSIKLFVNNQLVEPEITGRSREYFLKYQPLKPYKYGRTINVDLFIEDLAENPNRADTSWQFTVLADTAAPLITKRYPNENQPQVFLEPDIRFHLLDEPAGVDLNETRVWIDNELTEFEVTGDSSDYSFIIKLKEKLDYGQTVSIRVASQDLAYIPNVLQPFDWQFTTIAYRDTVSPYALDHSPVSGERDVRVNNEIRLKIYDDDSGVDTTSIVMKINGEDVQPEFVALDNFSKKFEVIYTSQNPFHYNEIVHVNVTAQDFFENPMDEQDYFFYIVEDKEPPHIYDRFPIPETTSTQPDVIPVFKIRDNLSGVDPNSICVMINQQTAATDLKKIEEMAYEVTCFSPDKYEFGETVLVTVTAADLALNRIDSVKYWFKIAETRPDLRIENFSTNPARGLIMNVPFDLMASIRTGESNINEPFAVTFYQMNEVILDTMIDKIDVDSVLQITKTCIYPKGEYKFRLVVDSKDAIQESMEINNFADLLVSITEGQGRIAPNPFTPNGDGFNDEIRFDFTQLSLNSPELKLFNFQAQPIVTLNATGKAVFSWNGIDAHGNSMPPGVYLYMLMNGKEPLAKGYFVLAR